MTLQDFNPNWYTAYNATHGDGRQDVLKVGVIDQKFCRPGENVVVEIPADLISNTVFVYGMPDNCIWICMEQSS